MARWVVGGLLVAALVAGGVSAFHLSPRPGAWLIHCHVLEHHAGGMGTTFEVRG